MRNNSKIIISILIIIFASSMVVEALVPVTYKCCKNYTYSDGVQISDFEPIASYQISDFENLSNWTVGGTGGSQEADTVNFTEGNQGLKLIARNGNRSTSDSAIDISFSGATYFSMSIYVHNISTFNEGTIYFSSTASGNYTSFFYSSIQNLHSGWNNVRILKSSFNSTGGESWNNIMRRVRIAVYPSPGNNTNVTLDDLKFYQDNDWVGSSQEIDPFIFKEGRNGLKLIVYNGSLASPYSDYSINQNFSNVNNFVFWMYVDKADNLGFVRLYLTSTSSGGFSKFFEAKIWRVRSGWNKIVFNRHDFQNYYNENWNNVIKRVRIRVGTEYKCDGYCPWKFNATFDDLRYDLTGQRAKLIITFDDGWSSDYTKAYQILKANNQTAVSYVVTSRPGTGPAGTYANMTYLKSLQSAGWDIGSHTVHHVDLEAVNEPTRISEINDSYDWLVANKFQKSAGFLAYPYGAVNDTVINLTEKRYVLARSIEVGAAQQHYTQSDVLFMQKVIEAYGMGTYYTPVDNIIGRLNDTINAKLLGIILFHEIANTPTNQYQYSTSEFQQISNYIKSRSSDVDVITQSDYVIPIIRDFTPVLNKTTRIYSNGTSVLITNNKYDEYMPNMTVEPLYGQIDINITTFNESGGLIRFNESSSNSTLKASYKIANRIPNKTYKVKIYREDGSQYQDFNVYANSSGYIIYNSTGFEYPRYQEINITVNSVNNAPIANNDTYITTENTLLSISAPGLLANDTDPDSDVLTAIQMTDPSNGTLARNSNGSFSYIPTTGFNGVDSFTYKANDSQLDSNIATVTITVTSAIDPNLVAYWKFDENSGTNASDSSGNGNHGTVSGATWTSGKLGTGLGFDGLNDYVDAGNPASLQITGAISMEGWVKINDLSVASSLFGRGHGLSSGNNGYFLSYYASTKSLYFDTYSTTTRDALYKNNAIIDNNWHHIAVTWDGTTSANGKKMYIDGVQVAQKTSAIASMGNPSYNFRIGISSLNSRPAKATTDEVKVYNRALLASEILADYNAGINDTAPPTISAISSSSITSSSASISWTTDEASNTQVEYGMTSSYGSNTTLDTNPVTSHSQFLSGLTASTLYHYRVKSRDVAGNLAISDDQTFTTSGINLSLIASWKLDENTGTTASDSSGNNNIGTIFGATWTSGKIGSALNFDGINDYVDAGNPASLQITGAISMEGWVKINDLSVTSSLFGRGHGLSSGNQGYFLSYYAKTKSLYFDTYSTTTRDALYKTNAIIDNNWHHIAVTWDGTTSANGKKMYIDGVQVAQKTSAIASMGNPSYNFRIGIDSTNDRPAKANIDEVKVFNRALSASEVLAHYNGAP